VPVYKSDEPGGFAVFGGPKDYGVSLSKSAATGPDGRLSAPDAIVHANFTDPAGGPDGCSVAVGAGGPRPRVQETPGMYYWQVWRLCTGCPTGYEAGPVRKLTLASDVKPALKLPRRAYAGYPFFATVAVSGAPNGTEVVVERQVGQSFKRAGTGTALGGSAAAVVTLPKGRQVIRARLAIGSQTITSDSKSITAIPAREWTTTRSDGSYTGRSVKLKIARRGHELEDFRAFVPMTCPGLTPGQFTTQVGTAALEKAKIAPDGSFVAASTPQSGTTIRVRGRLKGRKITGGRAELSLGTCSGSLSFEARR
jgi:hypothetical protein